MNIEPGCSGIYVTCVRGHEKQCQNEMIQLFEEYSEGLAGEKEKLEANDQELSIEDSIAQELSGMKEAKKTTLFVPVDLNCECVLFFRTRKPIDPVQIVQKICQDVRDTKVKKTRYAQRLTPVTLTAAANLDNLKTLAPKVLGPHFHTESGQQPVKFAIRPTIRNHNTLDRNELIRTVAEAVGHDHGHSVDLKKFDKMILVECFKVSIICREYWRAIESYIGGSYWRSNKSSLGMSVVENFNELEKFNIQQIYEKVSKGDEENVEQNESKG